MIAPQAVNVFSLPINLSTLSVVSRVKLPEFVQTIRMPFYSQMDNWKGALAREVLAQ